MCSKAYSVMRNQVQDINTQFEVKELLELTDMFKDIVFSENEYKDISEKLKEKRETIK